jgi:L-lactate dehydrogenase complex protein LldG
MTRVDKHRERILSRLREAKRPFSPCQPVQSHHPVTHIDTHERAGLQKRFVEEAEALQVKVYQPVSNVDAVETVLSILREDKQLLSWSLAHIPLPELADRFAQRNIQLIHESDPTVRVGMSGADAALATTGSLVLMSGNGRFRTTTLLPECHIAIIRGEQILPDLESWFAKQRQADGLNQFKQASNIVLVSGASRTGDIAMELVMGVHGPGELHIIILSHD